MDAHSRIYAAMNADYDTAQRARLMLAERRASQLRRATRISIALLGIALALLFSGAIHALSRAV